MFSDLKIVPTCPEFEQFHPSISGIGYVGHLYSEGLEESHKVRPSRREGHNILVYMGIGDIDLNLMEEVFPATFDGTRYQVRVVVGDFYPVMPTATQNVSYYRFLPLKQVLAETELVIFHGGSGLVMTCLLYGVPGLMFPCGVYEREFHAETMAAVNAGIVLYEREQFNVREITEKVEIILNGNYQSNAEKFGNYLRSLGGPARAVGLLADLVSTQGRYSRQQALSLSAV